MTLRAFADRLCEGRFDILSEGQAHRSKGVNDSVQETEVGAKCEIMA